MAVRPLYHCIQTARQMTSAIVLGKGRSAQWTTIAVFKTCAYSIAPAPVCVACPTNKCGIDSVDSRAAYRCETQCKGTLQFVSIIRGDTFLKPSSS